jgi:hypothetical protein
MTGFLPHRIRKIRLCSCTLHLISFLFSSANFLLVSMFVLLIGELQTTFLLIHFKGNSWCLMVPAMEGKKGAVPPFDQ